MHPGQSAQARKPAAGPTGLACDSVRRERSGRELPLIPTLTRRMLLSGKSAQVVLPTPKEAVTMRLDADRLRWFRRERGQQTRINAILRAYMQAHES